MTRLICEHVILFQHYENLIDNHIIHAEKFNKTRQYLFNSTTSQELYNKENQRTNGPVNAHLYGLGKHKTYKTWKIYCKEMTLTFNTHIPS